MRIIPVLLPLLLAAGCASPEMRLERGLVNAGLSPAQSSCMAERMVDKLSLGQLQRIASLRNFGREDIRQMTIDRFMHNIRALNDSEIVSVTTRAALGCAISG